MATTRRCGSRRCGGWNPTACRASRMLAINFTDPLARSRRHGGAAEPLLDRGPAPRTRRGHQGIEAPHRRIARGAGRQFARRQFDPQLSSRTAAAPMSATPCCAAFPITASIDWDDSLGNEFNGRGPFLRGLNEGDSEVTPGTAFLTLRSDGIDKYAQADGRFVGKPGDADRDHRGRPGAEGRHQSRARRDRSSRDRVSSARVPRDLQIHRRPRAGRGSRSRRKRKSS